jgi:hypothetical protein
MTGLGQGSLSRVGKGNTEMVESVHKLHHDLSGEGSRIL